VSRKSKGKSEKEKVKGEESGDVRIMQLDRGWGFYCWITDKDNAKTLVQNGRGGIWKDRATSRQPAERVAIVPPSRP
jgi:hypothetical protein